MWLCKAIQNKPHLFSKSDPLNLRLVEVDSFLIQRSITGDNLKLFLCTQWCVQTNHKQVCLLHYWLDGCWTVYGAASATDTIWGLKPSANLFGGNWSINKVLRSWKSICKSFLQKGSHRQGGCCEWDEIYIVLCLEHIVFMGVTYRLHPFCVGEEIVLRVARVLVSRLSSLNKGQTQFNQSAAKVTIEFKWPQDQLLKHMFRQWGHMLYASSLCWAVP